MRRARLRDRQGSSRALQQSLEVRCNLPEAFQLLVFAYRLPSWNPCAVHGTDHKIAIGMFRRHKLYNISFVAADPEDQRAKGIGQEISQALAKDAVLEHRAERVDGMELLVQLMVAARSTHDQARPVEDALS